MDANRYRQRYIHLKLLQLEQGIHTMLERQQLDPKRQKVVILLHGFLAHGDNNTKANM